MAESIIDLLFRIRKAGSGGKETKDELDKANKAAKDFKSGAGEAIKALTGFDVASLTAAGAIAGVSAAIVGSIKHTLEWAGSIDKLSRNTGLTTEEASKLAIVAGDVGIEMGTLEKSLKAMNKDGLELNLDTLKKVSAQYNATEDPVKRLKIATDAFGSAAQDMTEILTRTPEELDALAKSAELSGKVMSEDSVAAAEKFEQGLKQLQDRVDGLKVSVGNALIPILNTAGESFGNLTKINALLIVKFQAATGIISDNEAAQRAAAIAAGDLMAAYQEQVDSAIDPAIAAHIENTAAQQAENEAAAAAANALSFQNLTLGYGTSAYTEHTAAVQAAKAAEEAATAAVETSTRIYNLAEQALAAANIPLMEKVALEEQLALASGKTTPELEKEKDAVAFLTTQLAANNLTKAEYLAITAQLAAGELTAQQAMDAVTKAATDQTSAMAAAEPTAAALESHIEDVGGAATASASDVADLRAEIAALQDKTITVTTIQQSHGGGGGDGQGRAHGGPVYAGEAYMVGEQGPEPFFPAVNGRILSVAQAQQALSQNTNMGGVTININGAGNPQAVAAAVRAELDRIGRRADARIRA